jgi:hypothetical protein
MEITATSRLPHLLKHYLEKRETPVLDGISSAKSVLTTGIRGEPIIIRFSIEFMKNCGMK